MEDAEFKDLIEVVDGTESHQTSSFQYGPEEMLMILETIIRRIGPIALTEQDLLESNGHLVFDITGHDRVVIGLPQGE